MSTSNFLSYKNFKSLADGNSHDPSLYFYIKNYCFRKMIGLVQQDSNNFNPDESAIIQNDLKAFKIETQNLNVQPLTKEAFTVFIEKYFNQFNFESKDIRMYKDLKDVTEIYNVFGPLDEITLQRSKLIKKN